MNENGFTDLSTRTAIFRNKLIEEFRLLEQGFEAGSANVPFLVSTDLEDTEKFKKMLREQPGVLVKFKIFKRQQTDKQKRNIDKRMTRIKNANSVPFAVFAHWLLNQWAFDRFITLTVICSAVLLGVEAELPQDEYYAELEALHIIDLLILVIFILEIALKWLDSFKNFWKDGWNIFDFVITVCSALAEAVPQGATQIGAVRVIRIFRTVRSLRTIARFRSLRVILRTIQETLRSMTFIMVLLAMITYIFALVGMDLFQSYTYSKESGLKYQYMYENLGQALMSMFQLLTLDQWYKVYIDITRVVPKYYTIPFFITWMWVGAFIFKNIFIGVMVEDFQRISQRLAKSDEQQSKKQRYERMRKRLNKALDKADGKSKRGLAQAKAKTAIALIEQANVAKEAAQAQLLGSGSGAGSSAEANINHIMASIQNFLLTSKGDAAAWEETVGKTLSTIAAQKTETFWPRDTLFIYLQTMAKLQENMKEYQELQLLASWALYELHDT